MLWSLATPRIRARLPFKRVNPTHLPLTPSLVEDVDKWPLHLPTTDQRTNGKQKTENRKCKTGRIDPFSVFRFRFSIALSVGRFEKIDTLGKEGGPDASFKRGNEWKTGNRTPKM